jgi:hypothetical protein
MGLSGQFHFAAALAPRYPLDRWQGGSLMKLGGDKFQKMFATIQFRILRHQCYYKNMGRYSSVTYLSFHMYVIFGMLL